MILWCTPATPGTEIEIRHTPLETASSEWKWTAFKLTHILLSKVGPFVKTARRGQHWAYPCIALLPAVDSNRDWARPKRKIHKQLQTYFYTISNRHRMLSLKLYSIVHTSNTKRKKFEKQKKKQFWRLSHSLSKAPQKTVALQLGRPLSTFSWEVAFAHFPLQWWRTSHRMNVYSICISSLCSNSKREYILMYIFSFFTVVIFFIDVLNMTFRGSFLTSCYKASSTIISNATAHMNQHHNHAWMKEKQQCTIFVLLSYQ